MIAYSSYVIHCNLIHLIYVLCTSGVVRASGTDITVISPSSSPSSSPEIAQTVSSYKYT